MSAKHTPGPWRPNSSWIEGPKMALRVAAVDWPKLGCAPKTIDEAKANARLIAAAPNLLAALRGLVKVNEAHNESIAKIIGKPLDWKDDYLNAARAAIAAATGDNHEQ